MTVAQLREQRRTYRRFRDKSKISFYNPVLDEETLPDVFLLCLERKFAVLEKLKEEEEEKYQILLLLFQGISAEKIARRLDRSLEWTRYVISELLESLGYLTVTGLVADYALWSHRDLLERHSPFYRERSPLTYVGALGEKKWAMSDKETRLK